MRRKRTVGNDLKTRSAPVNLVAEQTSSSMDATDEVQSFQNSDLNEAELDALDELSTDPETGNPCAIKPNDRSSF